MPAGLFDPTFDPEAGPLDLPVPEKKANKWKDLAPLLAILPIAFAKGGRVGGAALLEGFQQARQQRAQSERQAGIDAENRSYRDAALQNQRAQIAATEQAKRDAAANAEATRRQTFLTQFNTGLEGIDTPEAAQAYLALQQAQGRTIGVNPDELARLVPSAPALSQKRARKALEQLQKARPDDWMNWSVKVDGQDVKATDLLGLSRDPNATPAAPKDDDAPLDRRYLSASVQQFRETNKREPTAAEMQGLITAAKKAVGQADDRPRITVTTPTDPHALPPRVQQQVSSIAKGFDALPIVKSIQKQAEAVSFAESLNPNTANPADDQALIYAFAKAMDPDSVVREGEYATVQKYAQSWAQTFGFNAARIFSNTAFLTPKARANMKATIRTRYLAGLNQYNNVRQSNVSKINKMTGRQDGADYLTDYAGGFPAVQQQAAPNTPSGAGTRTKVGRFEVEVGP